MEHFVNAPSQWATTSNCNVVSHWLGAYTKLSLWQSGNSHWEQRLSHNVLCRNKNYTWCTTKTLPTTRVRRSLQRLLIRSGEVVMSNSLAITVLLVSLDPSSFRCSWSVFQCFHHSPDNSPIRPTSSLRSNIVPQFFSLLLYQLEQLERLRSEDIPHHLMITHTIDSYWIPSQKKTLHATHLLKLLDKMCKYKMDPSSIVEDTERTRFCPRTDRRPAGQTDKVKPVYPPFNFVEVGGIIILIWYGSYILISVLIRGPSLD